MSKWLIHLPLADVETCRQMTWQHAGGVANDAAARDVRCTNHERATGFERVHVECGGCEENLAKGFRVAEQSMCLLVKSYFRII